MAINDQFLQYGGDLMIFIHSGATKEAVAFSTNAKLSVSMKTRDISSKDSGQWTEKKAGKYEWTMSTDALYNLASTGTTMSADDLWAYFKDGVLVNVGFASKSGTSPSWTINSSVKNFTGQALITSFDVSSDDGDTAKYTISLEGSGALTLA